MGGDSTVGAEPCIVFLIPHNVKMAFGAERNWRGVFFWISFCLFLVTLTFMSLDTPSVWQAERVEKENTEDYSNVLNLHLIFEDKDVTLLILQMPKSKVETIKKAKSASLKPVLLGRSHPWACTEEQATAGNINTIMHVSKSLNPEVINKRSHWHVAPTAATRKKRRKYYFMTMNPGHFLWAYRIFPSTASDVLWVSAGRRSTASSCLSFNSHNFTRRLLLVFWEERHNLFAKKWRHNASKHRSSSKRAI